MKNKGRYTSSRKRTIKSTLPQQLPPSVSFDQIKAVVESVVGYENFESMKQCIIDYYYYHYYDRNGNKHDDDGDDDKNKNVIKNNETELVSGHITFRKLWGMPSPDNDNGNKNENKKIKKRVRQIYRIPLIPNSDEEATDNECDDDEDDYDQDHDGIDEKTEEKAKIVRIIVSKEDFEARITQFISNQLLAFLYMHIENLGYETMVSLRCKESGKKVMDISKRSFEHNCEVIGELLSARWAKQFIHVGCQTEWEHASRRHHHYMIKLNKQMKKNQSLAHSHQQQRAYLWIHINDISRIGKSSTSNKSKKWSYQLDRPAVRFISITDGEQRIRQLWGPLLPNHVQQPDYSEFLQVHRNYIQERFRGAVFIAPDHFRSGNELFDSDIYFCCNRRLPRKEDLVWNEAHKIMSARIESPLSKIKTTMFKSLNGPFVKSEQQLTHLVTIACALHNIHN